MMKLYFSGILICVGSIIEAQTKQYFQKQQCAKAREFLVLKWAMIGFLLTTGYKEILLSKLINIEYEKGLDSVEDVIESKKSVVYDGASAMHNLLKSDPRERVKELRKRATPYEAVKGNPPAWVVQGYN